MPSGFPGGGSKKGQYKRSQIGSDSPCSFVPPACDPARSRGRSDRNTPACRDTPPLPRATAIPGAQARFLPMLLARRQREWRPLRRHGLEAVRVQPRRCKERAPIWQGCHLRRGIELRRYCLKFHQMSLRIEILFGTSRKSNSEDRPGFCEGDRSNVLLDMKCGLSRYQNVMVGGTPEERLFQRVRLRSFFLM